MKYVMLLDSTGAHYPFIFPEILSHDEVALHCKRAVPNPSTLMSAGFYHNGQTYGKSESLGVGSRTIDAVYIRFGTSVMYMPETLLEPLFGKFKREKG